MLNQITPLILTYNEAPNIGRVLERLEWARDIVVVDSFSDDDTLEVVSGFSQARVIQRKFDAHAKQWEFGLRETGITSEWVLALDSDYILTPEFVDELKTFNLANEVNGYQARFTYCINGRRLRSGVYPPVTVFYRRNAAHYIQDGHTHRVVVDGKIDNLSAPILHDDRKPLSHWFAAQSLYTKLEAEKIINAEPGSLGLNDRIRRWRIVAPPAMLFYCLIVRGGVFDGWAGFYYAFQRALAELMLSLRISEFGFRNADETIANCGLRNSDLQSATDDENTNLMDHQDCFDPIEIRNPKSVIRNL